MAIENKPTKIMIAEDQLLLMDSLVSLLRDFDEFEIIGLAGNGLELLQLLEKEKPDVILMDIKMPIMNGVEVTKVINDKMPWVKVIALSMYDHPVFIKEMLKSGAKGFLSKNCKKEELYEAIKNVQGGKTYLSKNAQEIVLQGFANDQTMENFDSSKSLTSREIEIIQLLAEGLYTKEIALKLFISEKTVERHKTNILKKMQLRNTAQLVKVAVERGIIFK
jgi:two-component system, NarL family, nitrate/nitrite response regulator NarL